MRTRTPDHITIGAAGAGPGATQVYVKWDWADSLPRGFLSYAWSQMVRYPVDELPDEARIRSAIMAAEDWVASLDMTPLGIAEVAELAGVARQTADNWRTRDVLPPARWTVGGRPAWARCDIDEWARITGRDATGRVMA